MRPFRNRSARYGNELWPVLLLFFAAVLVPTVCVLWFMVKTVANERFAVRQKLAEAWTPTLVEASERVDAYWQDVRAALGPERPGETPAQRFARLVRAGVCDTAVILNLGDTGIGYPEQAALKGAREPEGDAWNEAGRTEFIANDVSRAADLYAAIAGQSNDPRVKTYAWLAQARCLARGAQTEAAIALLTGPLASDELAGVADGDGNLLALNAQLRALELMRAPSYNGFNDTADLLARGLSQYDAPTPTARQRVYLMQRLLQLRPGPNVFDTLDAELLAAEYLARSFTLSADASFSPTSVSGIWQLTSPERDAVGLFRQSNIFAKSMEVAGPPRLADKVAVRLSAVPVHYWPDRPIPGPAEQDGAETWPENLVLARAHAGNVLSGWNWVVVSTGDDPFATAAHQQVLAYLWAAGLTVAALAILLLLASHFVMRQLRLAHLKNDLIATVSHELKTPLASMRVLVDTLIDGHSVTQEQVRDYLELIATENSRLSRLIDNFLAFSRMERNKQAFQFDPVRVEDVIRAAVEAAGERFRAKECQLDVEVAPDLPLLIGDRDGLITVVLNLLDNAYKYSNHDKRIRLQAYEDEDNVCIEVADNGIGLSHRAAKKVFDRFYQVDQSLSRKAGGCGLGLSIAKFIVTAHRGSIAVQSESGKGSTFTVRLPAKTPSSATRRQGAPNVP